jgi:quinol monooxygenase YgiN
MAGEVSWLLEMSVNPGRLEDFRSLMKVMVDAAHQDEPGTLMFEWFVSDDDTAVHIYERYVDSDATMIHLGNFGAKFAEDFLSCANVARWTIYGEPSDQVREAVTALGAQIQRPFGGFAR